MDTKRPLPLALLAALAAGALSGCSNTTTVGTGRALRVALSEYRVTPQDVSASPGLLTITVRNYGRLTHDLVITLNGVIEAQTKPIPPGQVTQLDATLVPGHYLMSSSILSDQALGAYATLDVGS